MSLRPENNPDLSQQKTHSRSNSDLFLTPTSSPTHTPPQSPKASPAEERVTFFTKLPHR